MMGISDIWETYKTSNAKAKLIKAEKRKLKYKGELLLVEKTDRGIVTSIKEEIYSLSPAQWEQIKAFLTGVLNGGHGNKRNR